MTTQPPTVRPATPADVPELLALEADLIRYDRQFDATLDPEFPSTDEARQFFTQRASGDGLALIAEHGGQPVGYLVGCVEDAPTYRKLGRVAELEEMFVAPACRGSGTGAALYRAFVDWARSQNAVRLQVCACAANRLGIAFYERMGLAVFDTILECDLPPEAP